MHHLPVATFILIALLFPFEVNAKQPQKSELQLQAERELLDKLQMASRRLYPFMTPKEQKIALKILFTKRDMPLIDVHAFRDKKTKKRYIAFNGRAELHYSYLADAMFLFATQIKDPDFLQGYMRYLANYQQFLLDGAIKSPLEFGAFFGTELVDPDATTTPESPAFNLHAMILRHSHFAGIFEFLIAHETGHHVLGHLDKPKGSSKQQRQREWEADKWAINLLIKSGNVSASPIVLMLYFNERDYRTSAIKLGRVHPAGIDRALLLARHYIKGLKRWRHASQRMHNAIGRHYDHQKTLRDAAGMLGMLQGIKQDQKLTSDNPKYWFVLAIRGDKQAQSVIASSFSHALRDYPHDWEKSIEWHKRVVSRPHKYAYFNIANSEYALGYFYAFHKKYIAKYGRNFRLAKRYLKRSAKKRYNFGVNALKHVEKLQREGK